MDIETIDDVIYWINRQPDWQAATTEDVVARSREADIPEDAKDAIAEMPRGTWTRAQLVAEVREVLVERITR